MTKMNNAPQIVGVKGEFDWESERTLVDQRRSPLARVFRVFRSVWFWMVLIGIVTYALFDANFMRTLISIAGLGVQIVLLIGIFLMQFVLMFAFVSRSREVTVLPGEEGVSFKDYVGQPHVLEQARQIVTLLRGVTAFEGAGGQPLSGLLLEGPPGTGKTRLAQAISTEAHVPFFSIDTSSLQGMFMGVGAMKVSRIYRKARKAAKEYGAAVIFLDEIDTVGSRGGVSGIGGGTTGIPNGSGLSTDTGLLNTLLLEMDGFKLENSLGARIQRWWYKKVLHKDPPKPTKRVLTIGATNRIQALDPALLRPGRFDKKLRIDLPDMEGRRDLFAYYLSKMASDETMNPLLLSAETPGYTPADIAHVLNETLRHALFEGRTYMRYEDFQQVQATHERGLRSPMKNMSKEALERIATYQAGTAVAIRVFMPHHRITRITIVRQGMAFGHVAHFPARESYQGLRTREHYLNRLRVAVAGRAAEIEFCGLKNQTLIAAFGSTSHPSDLYIIRTLLNSMAMAGMFGPLGGAIPNFTVSMMGVRPGQPNKAMVQAMEEAYQEILRETRAMLRERGDILLKLRDLLLKKHEISADEVRAFFDTFGLHTPDPTLIRGGEEVNLLAEVQTGQITAGEQPSS
ncbi:MAG: AAA family ATPase [Anaerolineae bacterium]